MDLRPSSLNSSFNYAFTYDVFLSFRGSDTRYGFTGNLYKALCDKGIHCFIDDRELQGGDEITPSLMRAIEKSKIAIPVFSINYAYSSFCLDELVNIMKRKDIMLVVPIFYDVDPSVVRHQNGSYGEALANHEKKSKANKEKLEEWKMALHQAANLSGHHFKHGDRYEYEFIGKIVDLVSSTINHNLLHVVDYPVGLESQIKEVKKLLDDQLDKGANMVGIYGPGGMGKTTLALAIYNLIAHHFDYACFLQDVRENSKKHGLQHLQSVFVKKIFGEKENNLASVNEGISILQHRLQQKKVLLVLDDVDTEKQLQAIAGRPNWFGPGSKVIITTRDKQLLACHKVEKTYEVKELDKQDALQLLTWKAFKSEQVGPGYVDVLNRAVTYASGLPLALEVIGSNLYGKGIEEWDSALNQYAKIPNNRILEILKKSYDALEEEEKSVFLDIACCFKGYGLEEVNDVLYAHYGDNMKHHIQALVDKSLIKIVSPYNYKITLHDLIEDMGKEIVRQESPKELGKQSRLWFHEDVVQVLKHNKGSNRIEIIYLQFPFPEEEEEKVEWDGDAFKKMENLKTVIIKNGYFSQGPNYLPNSLRVLEWNKYPSKDLPSGFCPNNFLICKLPSSSLRSTSFLPKKWFVSLMNLNFDYCENLTQIPDISCLQCLEKLSFAFCENLHRIHNSVGSLKKLKILDACGCKKLRSFPPLEMTSLEYLDLSYCDRLESFPEISVKMENMRRITLVETHIKKLPWSFRNLTKLEELYMRSNSSLDVGTSLVQSIITMPELTLIVVEGIAGWVMPKENEVGQKVSTSNVQSIKLTNCKLTEEFFLVVATWFPNVKELILDDADFIIIPECIKECCFLEKLELRQCWNLQEIRGIPPKLKYFKANDCPVMTDSCRSMLLKQELHEPGNTDFIVPYTPIPKWFDHCSRGPSVSFWFRNDLPELVLCLALPDQCLLRAESLIVFYLFINGNECSCASYEAFGHTRLFNLNKWRLKCNLNKVLPEKGWNFAEFKYICWPKIYVIESGIHVVKQESSMEDIRYTNPCRERILEDYLSFSESQNNLLLENHRFLDMDVSGRQIMQQQRAAHGLFPLVQKLSSDDEANEDSMSLSLFPLLPASERLSLDVEANEYSRSLSLFPLLPAFEKLSLDDEANEDSRSVSFEKLSLDDEANKDSRSLVPMQIRSSNSGSECQREELPLLGGIHVIKQESIMEDIRFTNPHEERELEDDLDCPESLKHQLLEDHTFFDVNISGTQIVHPQHMGFWSRIWNQACSCFPFLLAPAMQSLDDNVNDQDSRSLASTQIREKH